MSERLNIRRTQTVEKATRPAPFDAQQDISESDIKKMEKLYDDYLRNMDWKDVIEMGSRLKILRPNKMLSLDASQIAGLRRQLHQLKTAGLEDYMEFAAEMHCAFPTIKLDIPRDDIRSRISSGERIKHKANLAYYFKILFPEDSIPLTDEDRELLEWRIEDNTQSRPGVLAKDLVIQKALFPESHKMTREMWKKFTDEIYNIRRDPSILARFGSNLQLLAAEELRFGANGIEAVKRTEGDKERALPETSQV